MAGEGARVSEAPLTFSLTFHFPDYNALKLHAVGGGRGQIEVAPESIRAFEDMVALAYAEHGVIFEATVFVVRPQPVPAKVRGWREPKH